MGAVRDRDRTRDFENSEKMSLVFEGEALEVLLEIAKREDKRLDEVIEEALGLKMWALQVKDDGGKVVARRGRRDERELVL